MPVSIAVAAKRDFPVVLTGLGTVQASLTVNIHSQVDGRIDEVLFREGQHVKKGDVLVKLDPRLFQAALDQAKGKLAQDQAQLAGFQKDMARFTSLASRGFDTQQNVDRQQAKIDTSKAAVISDQAAIETAQTQLDYATIIAPSDGRMGVRLVDPGNVVHASDNTALAVLVRTQPTFVTFTLPAQTLDDARAALSRGDAQVVAYDRDNRKALSTGKLETIDNVIDQTTASYKLKATFSNDDERLWPGEFVNAHFQVDVRKQTIVVPDDAVQRGPKGMFIWVVNKDRKAEARPVKTDLSAEGLTIVSSGVTEGETVVTGGQYKLQAGGAVVVQSEPQPAS